MRITNIIGLVIASFYRLDGEEGRIVFEYKSRVLNTPDLEYSATFAVRSYYLSKPYFAELPY